MTTCRWTMALVAWTLFVWATRLGNIWGDADLSDGERWASTALALPLVVLALAVAHALWRQLWWLRPAVKILAGWTIAVWAVRAVGIATGDHDAAFVVVHLVLAIISVALAVLAIRVQTQPTTPQEVGTSVP